MAVKTIGTGAGLNVTPDFSDVNAWDAYMNALGAFSADETGRVLWASSANELVVTAQQVLDGSSPGSFNIILEAGDLNGAQGGSFKDNPNDATNALRYNAANGACIKQTSGDGVGGADLLGVVAANDAKVIIRNLQIRNAATGGFGPIIGLSTADANLTMQNCILNNSGTADEVMVRISGGTGLTMENSLVYMENNANSGNQLGMYVTSATIPLTITNCTFASSTTKGNLTAIQNSPGGNAVTIKNCAFYGWDTKDINLTGSITTTNCATDYSRSTSGLGGSNHQYDLVGTTEFESVTNGSEDFRLKSTSVKCRGGGTSIGAPTTDIIGQARS